MLFFRQEHIQRVKNRGWTQEFTVFVHAQKTVRERERENERQEETEKETKKEGQREIKTQKKKGWSVVAYVCGVKTKSCGSQACLQAGIHVKNSTREKLTNETRDFEPMQSAVLPLCSMVVNL